MNTLPKCVLVFGTCALCLSVCATGFKAYGQDDPCLAYPAVSTAFVQFQSVFSTGTNDLDNDGLQDGASLALIEAVACDFSAPASLKTATMDAFNINLLLFDAEADAANPIFSPFRDTIAIVMMISAEHEVALKAILAGQTPPITLVGNYEAVTCSGTTCVPTARQGRPLSEQYEVFAESVRATNEPYTASGDLDNDGTDNITEFNNVEAQGGTITDFVIAATSANLDGTEPIITPGGGSSSGCFIATAAFGTPLVSELDTLRSVRDTFLMPSAVGTAFVDLYYRLSPPVADRVAASPGLAGFVRMLLVPLVALSAFTLGANPLFSLIPMGLVFVVAVRRVRRARAR